MDVLIWGTGAAAHEFFDIAAINDINIIGCVDNNCRLWGQTFHDRPILPPTALADSRFDRLVLCSSFHEQIQRQIERCLPRLAKSLLIYSRGYNGPMSITKAVRMPYHLMRWPLLQCAALSKCNLLCAHCCRSELPRDDEFELPVKSYLDILSKFDPEKFEELCISEFGEISLFKDYKKLFDDIAALGWTNIQFVTNATGTNMDFFEYLFECNIASKVIISLESADPVLFKSIRGFSFKRYQRCVDAINALREKYCAKAELIISACCMKKNILHLPGIVAFAADNGFSHVGFVPLVTNEGVHAPNKLNTTQQALDNIDIKLKNRIYAETLALAERKQIQICLPEVTGSENKYGNDSWSSHNDQLVCTLPYDFVSVSKEGNIYPCCKMRRDCSLGNVFEQSFEAIWNGPGYARLFKSLRRGGTLLKNCLGCTVPQGYAW